MPLNSQLRIFLTLAITLSTSAFAQGPPTLVEDLIEAPAQRTIFRSFALAQGGDSVLFRGDDGRRGLELWITDGSVEGTRLWAEVCPGDCVLDPELPAQFGALAFDGTRAFFAADDGVHGVELWTSDGTEGGTRLVADLCPGPCSSEIEELTLVGGRAWFSIETPVEGREPWVSDGTAQGTVTLGNLSVINLSSHPRHFLPLGDKVAFQAFSDSLGIEWWQSDGTPEGTEPLTDLCPGACPAISNNPVAVDGSILFSVSDGVTEPIYLMSPGSEPLKLGELCANGGCDNLISFLYPAGDRFYFQTNGELWSTDLTPQGTGPVATLPLGSRIVQRVLGLDDGTVLVNVETKGFTSGLYRLDAGGLSAPLVQVDGLLASGSVGPYAVAVNNYSQSDLAVYRTDGTAAGTTLVGNLVGAGAAVYSGIPIQLGDRAVVNAYTNADRSGQDLWTIDSEGPEILLGSTERPGTALPENLLPLGSTLIYTARDPDAFSAEELRRISLGADGTGTSQSLAPRVDPESFEAVDLDAGPRALFGGYGDFIAARETSITDGTVAGTSPLLFNGSPISWSREPRAFQGKLVFFGDQGNGQKIWIATDPSDPQLLIDIDPEWINVHVGCGVCSPPVPPGPIYPRDLTVVGSQGLAFVALQDASGPEPWFSDGTTQGTFLIADLDPGSSGSDPEFLVSTPEHLIFKADSGDGPAWWSWSLGQEPTRLGATIEAYATASLDGRAYWLELTDEGFALGSSDGTDLQRLELPTGVAPSNQLVEAAGRLFFVAADADFGAELWTYDPAAEETLRLRRVDLRSGPLGSFPEALTAVDDGLYFSADDGAHGREAWRYRPAIDATPIRLTDLAPGSEPSSPRDFTTVTSSAGTEFLVFTADDGSSGRELWAWPISSFELCADDNETLCLQDGRFEVTARWRVPASGETGTAKAITQTDESGLFWFFDADNYELVVKVLDGTSINSAFWFFYGALSDVEYWIDVQDLATGATRSWHNPPGRFCGDADVSAFPVGSIGGLSPSMLWEPVPSPGSDVARAAEAAKTDDISGCVTDGQKLCLLDRFQITVDWISEDGAGPGFASAGTDETGFFWFFDSENTELVVKMLDGGAINGQFWFYYGALTDVEYTLRVLDTTTGQEAIYDNPEGQLCGGADTEIFPS